MASHKRNEASVPHSDADSTSATLPKPAAVDRWPGKGGEPVADVVHDGEDRGSKLKRYLPSNQTLVALTGLIGALAALVTALSGCNPV